MKLDGAPKFWKIIVAMSRESILVKRAAREIVISIAFTEVRLVRYLYAIVSTKFRCENAMDVCSAEYLPFVYTFIQGEVREREI